MVAQIIIYDNFLVGATAFEFSGDDLISCQYEQHSSCSGTELANDTMTATVRSENPSGSDELISSDGDYLRGRDDNYIYYTLATQTSQGLLSVKRGTKADLKLHDENTGQDYVYHYVFDSCKLISAGYWTLNFISPMTWLGEQACGGVNTYIGQPASSNTVGSLVSVFNQRAGRGTLLTVDPDIAGVSVDGIIEDGDSIRDAVCKLQMVCDGCIVNGNTLSPVYADGTAESIPEDNCGSQSITYPETNTRIDVDSWMYDAINTISDELFNSDSLDDSVLSGSVFDYYISDKYTKWTKTGNITVGGLGTQHITVDNSGLKTGKLTIYRHSFVATRHSVNETGITPTKIITVDNNKLINAGNWAEIADRLLAFYASAQKHEVTVYDKLLHTNHVYEFTDATGARKTGILIDVNVQISHTLASRCTFITDY